ncbi:hypothetical protein KFZ76_03280 [Methylovulum psychrotolerans]|uniref:hypothetical protein n=1 Tax=Methylovulum psychrotolerans TaxID=1704499 RepID=UPI001BFEEDC9|nr:hypothetical protein [Methylovulum psychrotolerans]MBT9096735.1 hypothetical protein [Methylovulum psychrotolerans]
MAKPSYEPQQDALNRMAIQVDTILTGRVLRKMVVNQGLVYANGNSIPLEIVEVEVLKTYRGKRPNDKKQLICTWIGSGEFAFDPPLGRELLIFGIQVGSLVQVPMIRYIRGIPENESEIYKVLKLKRKVNNKRNVFSTFAYDRKVIRNACNKPVVWPE